ncbi:MAG: ATP-binding protein [Chloroflexi bacterium]|nr:ATP-binding protein [Chloroflexota bacterium]
MDHALLDALPDGVVVVGADRTVQTMNHAAERLTGWSRAEAAGAFYGSVLPLRDASGFLVHEHADPFHGLLSTVTATPEAEYSLTRRDDAEVPVAVRAAFVRDGDRRLRAVVVSVREIRRRRRLDRAASDLISTVSHEIRSPLTSVKGFTSTLLSKWERFSDEQKRVMLQTINYDADRVTRLLGDLLDVSRLEAGRLELKRQEVDLAVIATDAVMRLRLNADEHRLEVSFPGDFPKITADPGRIEQVIFNLVENALKYATPGLVTVSGEDAGDHVIVRVADEGEGIDPDHLPNIFLKFYRRGSGERRTGTGLGLYICRGIVQRHGGELTVERSDATGTVFAFRLPKDPG